MVTSNDQDQDPGGYDIVDLLHERHEQIRDAFADVVAAEGEAKAALYHDLVTSLAVREAVAQELIRPLVESQGQARSEGTAGRAQEAEVMSRLASMDVEDSDFDAKLIGVAQKVTLRIEAQERDDLPLLRRSLPAGELRALARVLRSAETIARSSAGAGQAEETSPDAFGLRDAYAALADTIRRVERP